MTIHWSLFGLGVLLLLFPADRLLSSRVELRSFDRFHSLESSPRFRPWWWVPVLWLDPVRGFFGASLLQRSLTIDSTLWVWVPKPEYALLVGLLAIATMGQTLTRRGDRDVLLAPVGFTAGAVAALTPWPVALIGIAAALIGLFAFRQFGAYFVCGLSAVVLLGFALKAPLAGTAAAAGVFVLPVVTAFVTSRTLELPARDSSGPAHPRGST